MHLSGIYDSVLPSRVNLTFAKYKYTISVIWRQYLWGQIYKTQGYSVKYQVFVFVYLVCLILWGISSLFTNDFSKVFTNI